jgi:hypothetical protein
MPNNITNIPAPRVELADPRTGVMSREWYRFFYNLFNLSGAGSNIASLSDLQVGPPATSDAEMSNLAAHIHGLEVAPPVTLPRDLHYGAFSDSTSQTAAAINTAYALTFNTTQLSEGVVVGTTTSQIKIYNTGVYNFQFSAQLTKTTANLAYAYIWYRINGTNVANSATRVALAGSSSDTVPAWNFVAQVSSGDYFQLMWAVSNTGIQVRAAAATAFCPAIPSVILTVTEVTL